MIIFSPAKLEREISSGALTTWEKVKYLFLATVVAAVSGPVYWLAPVIKPRDYNTISLIQNLSAIIGLFITYYGIKKCYNTNTEKEDFIELFICLRVPWTVLFTVILVPTSLVLIYSLKRIFNDNPDIPYLVISISAPLVIYTYYHFLNGSFQRVCGSKSTSESPTSPVER